MRPATALCLLGSLVVLSAAGCAGSAGDRLLAAGDLTAAAEAYERAAAGADGRVSERSLRALFKLGVVRATPGSGAYDPQAARRAFETVARLAEGTPRALEASLLLGRLAADESRRIADLEARLAEAVAAVERLRAGPPVVEIVQLDAGPEVETELAASRQRIAELEEEVRRLKAEIEQIKELDLEEERPPLALGERGEAELDRR